MTFKRRDLKKPIAPKTDIVSSIREIEIEYITTIDYINNKKKKKNNI